jgi:hypothetical protein
VVPSATRRGGADEDAAAALRRLVERLAAAPGVTAPATGRAFGDRTPRVHGKIVTVPVDGGSQVLGAPLDEGADLRLVAGSQPSSGRARSKRAVP